MEPIVERKHIECSSGTCGGKPRIAGTRIRVQDVYVWRELHGQTPEEIVVQFPQLTLADVHSAIAYYLDHLEEIRRDLREEADFVARMKAAWGPGPLGANLQGTDADRGSVSS